MTQIDTSKTSEHYLASSDFFAALVASKITGKISDKLARMFILLSERNANHRNFVRYTHIREDIIAIGQLACLKGFDSFRPFKDKERSDEWAENKVDIEYNHEWCSNSFAFFTTCIRHAIIQHLKTEYNQSNIKNKRRLELGMDASFGYTDHIKEKEDEAKRAAGEEVDDDFYGDDYRVSAHGEE